MGSTNAPSVYGFQNQQGADQGAYGAIGSIPGAIAATGYNPANTVQQGQGIINSVQGLPQYAQAALQSGFDPQNAYYAQMQNQNQQQALAMEAAQGVSGTPYGAGLTNQSNQNFNLNWENQALQRQAQGAGTAANLYGAYGSGVGQGAGLQQSGGQFAAGVPQMQAQDYTNYLQAGTGASNARTSAFDSTQRASQAQWSGIGQLGGALAGAFL